MLNPEKDIVNYVHKYKPNGEWWKRNKSAIKRIVIHHPVVAIDRTPPIQTNEQRMENIMKGHIQRQYVENDKNINWQGLVYHFFIGRDPKNQASKAIIYKINNFEDITWHTGNNNMDTISICVDGYLHQDKNNIIDNPTESQLQALDDLVEYLTTELSIPRALIFGHSELRATSCPGNRLMPYVLKLKQGRVFAPVVKEEVEIIYNQENERGGVENQEIIELNNNPEIVNPPVEVEEVKTADETILEEIKWKPLEGEDREKKILELSEKIKENSLEYATQILSLADENTLSYFKSKYGFYKKIFLNVWIGVKKLFRYFKTPRGAIGIIKTILVLFGGTEATTTIAKNGLDSLDFVLDLIPIAGASIIHLAQKFIDLIKRKK